MDIKRVAIAVLIFFNASPMGYAAEDAHLKEHGGQIFHAFILEAQHEIGEQDPTSSWDLDGWIGGDIHKLYIKSEGEVDDAQTEHAEVWALYSRHVATFWDLQAGIRYDAEPESTAYLTLGVKGLAPYFFETEAHLFVSDEGDVSARFKQENELLITQRLILEPYLEATLFAQDIETQAVAAGLADAELGLQLRYEITRKFAPFANARYLRMFGKTASMAERLGEEKDDVIASVGLRLMF